ncbi:MAG TPA: adenylate kinase [Candidatus Rikenella faecigallinarum]|uniref:Adenylate kinase n=1 Tax=Candidatus Rikenella faecigallinarum TaxID=2838745 RepID=A0A9D1QFP5_9BACT|nr:adenylate kinase [Candidatus Rikenella faecigallinarum]
MLNIVLFGPPGAGKGTQAEKLQQKYGILHLSTGEVIRQEMNRGSELGRLAAQQMEGGKLASDELVLGIIENYLQEHRTAPGVIFDGFPRTLPQAEAFDSMLKKIGTQVTVMLALDVPDEVVTERILTRGKTSGRADDQSLETIQNRIAVYKKQTAVVADFYKKQDKFRAVNGVGTIDEIFDRLCAAIDALR